MTKDEKQKQGLTHPVDESKELETGIFEGESLSEEQVTAQNGEDAAIPAEIPQQPQGMDVKTLEEQLEKVTRQSAEYFEGWQRERADFLNYKKRIERDQSQLHQSITAAVLKKYLAISDDLERALKNCPAEGEAASWAAGVELIQRKLLTLLETEGLQRIPAENELFDPIRHEALTYEVNPDCESGKIIEVLQQGYIFGDRVIRPSLVRVAQ